MKIRITMKDCDYNLDEKITKAQRKRLSEWFEYDEYVLLEFDTKTNEMIVLKP